MDIEDAELRDSQKEIEVARQKNALQEVAEKFKKMLDRWERLEPLEFLDDQVAEATRCFLYGFNRAAIVLCASALERRLKRIARVDYFGKYAELVDQALPESDYERWAVQYAKEVFQMRNAVVHHDRNPSLKEAQEALDKTRKVLSELTET